MGKKDVFPKSRFFERNICIDRNSTEWTKIGQLLLWKRQRHESRPVIDETQTELTGELMAECGCSHFWNRQPTTGDDDRRCPEFFAGGAEAEKIVRFFDRLNVAFDLDLDARSVGFSLQHRDDLTGALVAEELPELFLMPGDFMFLDECEKIGRQIAAQCRAHEVRI